MYSYDERRFREELRDKVISIVDSYIYDDGMDYDSIVICRDEVLDAIRAKKVEVSDKYIEEYDAWIYFMDVTFNSGEEEKMIQLPVDDWMYRLIREVSDTGYFEEYDIDDDDDDDSEE